MIVVVGRPRFSRRHGAAGLAAQIAMAAAEAGAQVELVGSIGDDEAGQQVILELSRTGVGHAALLRDASARTPGEGTPAGPLPRLDAQDVELGLGYLVDYGVLVVAEPLSEEAQRVALDAAAYHGAQVLLLDGSGHSSGAARTSGSEMAARAVGLDTPRGAAATTRST